MQNQSSSVVSNYILLIQGAGFIFMVCFPDTVKGMDTPNEECWISGKDCSKQWYCHVILMY